MLHTHVAHPSCKAAVQACLSQTSTVFKDSTLSNFAVSMDCFSLHACCSTGEVGDLPALVFPFVKLFGANAEGCFELLATMLLNWTKGWFELFPNPPVSLLQRLLVSGLVLLSVMSDNDTLMLESDTLVFDSISLLFNIIIVISYQMPCA